jgi:tetratricopeptide (TPR) repeat protein
MANISSQQAFKMAQKLHQQGQLDKAEELYRTVLNVDRHHAESWFYLGMVYYGKGITQQAVECMKSAIEADRSNPMYHNNLGEIYRQLNMNEHAEFHLSAAVDLKPDYSDALGNLALIHKAKGDIDSAKLFFARALESNPENINALVNTGNMFKENGEYEDAAQCYEAALKVSPEYELALKLASECYHEMGDYNKAAAMLSKAIKGDPEKHADRVRLAFITLRNKDFRKGFQLLESRYKDNPSILEGEIKTLWRGTPLVGKTLYVYYEAEGLGRFSDTFMFARFLWELEKHKPEKVVFKVQKEILTALQGNMPEYVHLTDETCTDFDVHSPLASLPMVLNARAKTLSLTDGWLKPDGLKVTDFALKMAEEKKKVGLVFNVSKRNPKYDEMSLSQEMFESLYNRDDLKLFYVDKEKASAELHPSVTDMSGDIEDFSDTAAILANLDILITADSAVAHLAGCMGVKTFLILDEKHDWRWFNAKEGQNSLWYDSVVIYFKGSEKLWGCI